MGPTNLHDYTITADVKAEAGTAKLPDIGLIAQRYTFDMMGESQQLQIRTWAAQLRMARSISFVWEADTWYSLKFKASTNARRCNAPRESLETRPNRTGRVDADGDR